MPKHRFLHSHFPRSRGRQPNTGAKHIFFENPKNGWSQNLRPVALGMLATFSQNSRQEPSNGTDNLCRNIAFNISK